MRGFADEDISGITDPVHERVEISGSFEWPSQCADLEQIGNVIFRLPLKYDTPWPISLLVIIGVVVGSGLILERRVRGVEVVA